MAGYNTRSSSRKVANIKFVSDEDVLQHIVVDNDEMISNSFSNLTNKLNTSSDSSDQELAEDHHRKTPQVLHENGDHAGNDIFTFKSNKNKDAIIQKALNSVERSHSNKTEKRKRKKTSKQKSTLKLSTRNLASGEANSNNEDFQQTPYNLRRKIKRKLAKLATEEQQSTFDSDNSVSDDSESSDDDAKFVCKQLNFSHLNSDNESENESNAVAENYFRAQMGKSVTSNHTLSRLDNPRLNHASVQNALKSVAPTHPSQTINLLNQYKKLFYKFMFQLSEGFNLLFYGVGSKRQFLLDFRENMLSQKDCLVINGFCSNLTVKTILTSVIEDIFDSKSSQNPQEMLNSIKNLLSRSTSDLYLVIHNIDGPLLRSERAQDILCKLARIDKIRILASIDHINTPLIWDQTKLTHFNWIWHDVTNFSPYIDETVFENTLLVQSSNNLMLSSLTHVFCSLNPKAKGIFLMLAKHQLENKDSSTYIGIPYQDFYRKCRESFLVTSDLTFKTQLTEFKDHKLIKLRKDHDSVEHLFIPLEAKLLGEFVEQTSNK